jgi:hypothetical protein
MANVYSYTFDGTLPVVVSTSSPGSPQFAQMSGTFSVDFDRRYASGTQIPGEIFVNGQKAGSLSIFQTQNQQGIITSRIFSSQSQGFDFPSTTTNLYFNGQTPTSFINADVQISSSDYSTYPPVLRSAIYTSQQISVAATPVCFTTGTLIRTSRGDVTVEDLRVGDIAVTASGGLRSITWIGHREITAAAALPFHQQPVRIRAGAFGGGLPVRDLSLSPGHPVLVGADAGSEGGVLVPVMCLINGTTIARMPVETVTYWHVELDGHDILLAEGLPAESYIDGGDRAFFTEASDHALHNPDFVPAGWNARCRPVAADGPVVEAERQRLDTVFAGQLASHCAWDAHQNGI